MTHESILRWQPVPIVATEAMTHAAVTFVNGEQVHAAVPAAVVAIEASIYGEVYEAMLAAAPKPPLVDGILALTEEQCEAFRRLPGTFNHMLREVFAAGAHHYAGRANEHFAAHYNRRASDAVNSLTSGFDSFNAASRAALGAALEALKNHDAWHVDHDDHDGYPESELQQQSMAAQAGVEQALRSAPTPVTDDGVMTHADHLSRTTERLLTALGIYLAAQTAKDEGHAIAGDGEERANELLSEWMRGARSAVHEYRKRRERGRL